jgi:hypothetical protein
MLNVLAGIPHRARAFRAIAHVLVGHTAQFRTCDRCLDICASTFLPAGLFPFTDHRAMHSRDREMLCTDFRHHLEYPVGRPDSVAPVDPYLKCPRHRHTTSVATEARPGIGAKPITATPASNKSRARVASGHACLEGHAIDAQMLPLLLRTSPYIRPSSPRQARWQTP